MKLAFNLLRIITGGVLVFLILVGIFSGKISFPWQAYLTISILLVVIVIPETILHKLIEEFSNVVTKQRELESRIKALENKPSYPPIVIERQSTHSLPGPGNRKVESSESIVPREISETSQNHSGHKVEVPNKEGK